MSVNGSVNEVVAIEYESVLVSCCDLGCPNDEATVERANGNESVQLRRGRYVLAANHGSVIDVRNGNESENGSHCDGHGCANENGI